MLELEIQHEIRPLISNSNTVSLVVLDRCNTLVFADTSTTGIQSSRIPQLVISSQQRYNNNEVH